MRPETKTRIRNLGFRSYRAYLLSAHWRARRTRYFKRHPKICWICGSKKEIHLHHANYDRIGAELDSDLVPLCRAHHRGVHTFMKRKRVKVELAHTAYKAHLAKRTT